MELINVWEKYNKVAYSRCCCCKKILTTDGWQDVEIVGHENITDGWCDVHFEEKMAEVRRLNSRRETRGSQKSKQVFYGMVYGNSL